MNILNTTWRCKKSFYTHTAFYSESISKTLLEWCQILHISVKEFFDLDLFE